mgnify:FL=1
MRVAEWSRSGAREKRVKKMGVARRECLPSVRQREEGLGEAYGAYGPSDESR